MSLPVPNKTRLKRAFDLCVAWVALIVTSPLILALWLLVYLNLGSPVIFRQTRPGLRAQPFDILKFRTMTSETDGSGKLLDDARRLTPFGRFLRASSMDELPELWNVVRGEMSLVGPRPLLMSYVPLYSQEQARRHDVRPGITGWAQINGRNALGWDEKFKLDVWYVDHHSLWLDCKILARTCAKVILRQGISNEDHATMPHFTGNPE